MDAPPPPHEPDSPESAAPDRVAIEQPVSARDPVGDPEPTYLYGCPPYGREYRPLTTQMAWAYCGLMATLAAIELTDGWKPPAMITSALTMVMVSIAIVLQVRRSRLITRLRAAGFALCAHCGYDLSGSRPSGHCPECGRRFDQRQTIDWWKRHFD